LHRPAADGNRQKEGETKQDMEEACRFHGQFPHGIYPRWEKFNAQFGKKGNLICHGKWGGEATNNFPAAGTVTTRVNELSGQRQTRRVLEERPGGYFILIEFV
jgi:hypothetical protein